MATQTTAQTERAAGTAQAEQPAGAGAQQDRRRERRNRDVLSAEWVKLELLRTAYATRGGLFAAMDPRAVIVWYLVLAVAPWFTHDTASLTALFAIGVVSVFLARVGPLILGLFVIGLVGQVLSLLVVSLFFGGDSGTLWALVELNMKLGAVSLASMAAFVSLDPEKLSDALLAMRAPVLLAFGVSYGYRMLPIIVEEYTTVFDGFRLRSAPPQGKDFLRIRALIHWCTLVVKSFYPIMLNTAKSVRTTVEALEARGFTYAAENKTGRDLRLRYLKIGVLDVAVILVTLGLVALALWL